jgi:uroporphyrinogen-III synthase/uroporphyrinogen III methyltransferase/synthase
MSLPGPLVGRRVLVTRAAGQASKLSEALRALGAEPAEVPVIEIVAPESYEALDAAIRSLSQYDWLIFTSANAVRVMAARAAYLDVALDEPVALRLAAVGPATAAEVQRTGLAVTLVPEASFRAEGVLEALGAQAAGMRMLLARAATARDVLPEALRAAGAQVDVVDAYRNVMPKDAPEALRGALAAPLDAVTFTSSSSATHLKEAAERAGVAFPFAGVPAVSIGPITSATLRELGWEPAAEAEQSDIAGLVSATERVLRL